MFDNDLFTADTSTQTDIEARLRVLIGSYDSKIIEMKSIYDNISSSDSWKDTNIKSNFLSTFNNYILSFENLRDEMEKQVDELSTNTSNIDSIESAFS